MIIWYKEILKVLLLVALISAIGVPLTRTEAEEQGAKLWIAPSDETHNIGDVFSVELYVTSLHRSINVAEAELQFSNSNIELVRVSKEGSIFSFWLGEPFYSNKTGVIKFQGGLQSPGFAGAGGKILALNFKAIGEGPASIKWGKVAVLANDGNATNILTGKEDASFSITSKASGAPIMAPLSPRMAYSVAVILVVVIGGALAFLLRRKFTDRSRVDKGKISIETLVEGKFSDIRKNVSEELWILEKKLKKGEPFSKEERERREQLLRELGDSADEIQQKVKDI